MHEKGGGGKTRRIELISAHIVKLSQSAASGIASNENQDTTRPLPTHPPTYLPTYLPTSLPTYSLTHLPRYPPSYPPTHLPTHLPTSLPTYPLTHLPRYPPTYPPTYQLPTYQRDDEVEGIVYAHAVSAEVVLLQVLPVCHADHRYAQIKHRYGVVVILQLSQLLHLRLSHHGD